jgi:hypothetical protein
MSFSPAADAPAKFQYTLTADQMSAMNNLSADATHCALGGGSRSGKTFLIIRAIFMRACSCPNSRHLIARYRFNVAKTAIGLDTIPKVIRLCFPELPAADDMLNKTDWYYKLPNGSEVWLSGLDEEKRVEKVLGHEYASMFFNECSQIPWKSVETALTRLAQLTSYDEYDKDDRLVAHHKGLKLKAYYDLNPPSKRHWSYIRFISKKDPEPPHRNLANEFDYNYLTMNPHGNAANLDPKYLSQLEALGEGAKRRFLYGQWADDSDGSLWTEETLSQNRVLGQEGQKLPQWLRVVVAVDPSGTKGPEDKRSDEVGIVVVALGTDGHGYLIEDLSIKAPPEVWGKIVADAYDRHSADRIVGEVNYGGDMVRAVIQAQDPHLPFTAVTASRGKEVRAEPISAIYDQGTIHHIGYFPEIEEQLMAMLQSGYVGLRSPDRADALIWGFTELFPKMTKKDVGPTIPPKINVAPRSARSHKYAQNQNVKVNTQRGATKRRIRRNI